MGRHVATHREQQRLDDLFEYVVEPGDVPRDPAVYHPWEHFVEGLQDPEVNDELVERIFAEGEVYHTEGDNRYRFLWTDDRTLFTYILVVKLDPAVLGSAAGRHAVVTIYRWSHK
jgi:hypothetical protein